MFYKENGSMSMRTGIAMLSLAAVCLFCSDAVYAMGAGKTKVDFQVKEGSSRLFAKRDVKAGVDQLPEVGAKSKNDNLADRTITVTCTPVGVVATADNTLVGVADAKGRVTTPFDGKLTANGGIMQVKTSTFDIVKAFPLDMTDGEHTVTVQIKIVAQKKDPSTGAALGAEIVLSDEAVTFSYKAKKGAAKGKNF
jgi:hypothetical protein